VGLPQRNGIHKILLDTSHISNSFVSEFTSEDRSERWNFDRRKLLLGRYIYIHLCFINGYG
jgi:hypothetical protein